MASPFPGMDPYLENPDIFGNLHHDLIVLIQEQLQPTFPEPYYIRVRERRWYDESHRIEMRGFDRHKREEVERAAWLGLQTDGSTAQATISTPALDDEWHECYAEICVGSRPDQKVITRIEVLSPNNKGWSRKARKMYLDMQEEVLNSTVNLVEIDLLRGGAHTAAVPLDDLRKNSPKYNYHVSVRCFDERRHFSMYPFTVRDQLPTIQVPLQSGDGSLPLDLQAVFNRCYDVAAYDREVDYCTF